MSDLSTAISDLALRDYDRLRDDCGLVVLPDVALVEMTGEDRKGWLQGQATNNVRKFENGNSVAFCFSAATGHMIADLDGWAVNDRFLLTCAREVLDDVLRRVEQMVVLEDVVATEADSRFELFSIQGPTASRRLSEFLPLPSLDAGEVEFEGAQVYLLRSDRTGLGGWDVWIPRHAELAKGALRNAFPTIDFAAYDAARLEAGIPIFGRDMNAKTLPPEMGAAFSARHISYNKGCYVGQEVLMRIHSRGHTNRTWVGLVAESDLTVGAPVFQRKTKEVGVVTSAAFSPDYGFIGAAMVRNEVAQERETVTVTSESGSVEAEIRMMPILRLD